jgi:regulatory protein
MPAGKITALQAQAMDSQRVNVFINGTFAIGVSLTTLAREQLFIGKELAAEEYARLERAEQANRAIQAAMRAIESRPRSIREIHERLKRKGFEPDLIDHAITRLQDLRLLDDQAFARYWIEGRQHSQSRGPAALRDELRRKGVDASIIETALQDDELVGDIPAQAEKLARQVLYRYRDAADFQSFARRMGNTLQRRGYSFATIRPIIAQLWRECHDTTGDE